MLELRLKDQSPFELPGAESVNRRCMDTLLHICKANLQSDQSHRTQKQRDRIPSAWKFLGAGRPCFESLKSRYMGAQFATEKHALGCTHNCASSRLFSMSEVLKRWKESRPREKQHSILFQSMYGGLHIKHPATAVHLSRSSLKAL